MNENVSEARVEDVRAYARGYFSGRYSWVFNRTIKWRDDSPDGLIVCYSDAGDMYLTGENSASDWISDSANEISSKGGNTRFVKKNDKNGDCISMPPFQFLLSQHPTVELAVSGAKGDWQFVAYVKGHTGPPLISSGWKNGDAAMSFDIMGEMDRRGYDLQFAELCFCLGVWDKDPKAELSLEFSLRLPARPAIAACLPVIRTEKNAADGVPVAAIVTDGRGNTLGKGDINLTASLDGKDYPLEESGGVWKAVLKGLKKGDYKVGLSAEGAVSAKGAAFARVTDGLFLTYDDGARSLVCGGRHTGPLSGSFLSEFMVRDAGQGEALVKGQQDWDEWKSKNSGRPKHHGWESMTEKQFEEKFAYLEQCGWSLIHLCSHWAGMERLDAGGRISPHGAEQLSLYMRTAEKHGIRTLFALTHYPYGIPGENKEEMSTATWRRYYDEGYVYEDWKKTGNKFTEMFHVYLKHFAEIFRDETALAAMTASGEGDWMAEAERVNDTCDYMRSQDKNHLFISEPTFLLKKLPAAYTEGWRQPMFGSRTYMIAEEHLPEYELGAEFKIMQLGPVYMAEGCFPWQIWNKSEPWCGTRRYRLRLRDSLYLGMIMRSPIILTWEEQVTEDERIVYEEVRKAVDWGPRFMEPKAALIVDDGNADGEGRANLCKYEKAFVSMPLMYKLVTDAAGANGCLTVIDARKPFADPKFASEGGILPDALKSFMPVKISEGYSASYLWSEDRETLLAYVYNSAGHEEAEHHDLAGKFHRKPTPVKLELGLVNLPGAALEYKLYELDEKKAIKQGNVSGALSFDLGVTDKDYFVLVCPRLP